MLMTSILFTIACVEGDGKSKGAFVVDNRKRAVSIRLSKTDLRSVKQIARRLSVRDSDVIRFAIKSMLNRIGPLCDEGVTGRNLVPVFLESGDELIRFFGLDAYQLESIVNEKAREDVRVDRDDIALLAMSGLREHYLSMRINGGPPSEDGATRHQTLRMYLYDKYLRRPEEPKEPVARAAVDGDGRAGMQRPAA
jgi:hypothetical protein